MKKSLSKLSNYFFGKPNKGYKELSYFYNNALTNDEGLILQESLDHVQSLYTIGKTVLTALTANMIYYAFKDQSIWPLIMIGFTELNRNALSGYYNSEIDTKQKQVEQQIKGFQDLEEIADELRVTNLDEIDYEEPNPDLF